MRLIDADRLLDQMDGEITISVDNVPTASAEAIVKAVSDFMDKTASTINNQPTVYPMFAGRSAGKTALKDYMGMCEVLEYFGLSTSNPAETLHMVCENYQKVLMELTGGFMSKLNYTPDAVISYITDRYNDNTSEESSEDNHED